MEGSPVPREEFDKVVAEYQRYRGAWEDLHKWLMQTVGVCSTTPSAKKAVERCVRESIKRNKRNKDEYDQQCDLEEAISLLRICGPANDPGEWHRVMSRIDPEYGVPGTPGEAWG